MFTEIAAKAEVATFIKILDSARELNNDDVIKFCKDNVLPAYWLAKAESFGKTPPEELKLIDFFETF